MHRAAQIDGLKALAVTTAAAVLVLVASLMFIAERVDQQYAQRETQLVRLGYDEAVGYNLSAVEYEAIWDALVAHTTGTVDTPWLQANVVSSASWDMFGALVAVVGPDEQIAFARERARALPLLREAALKQALTPIIARLRTREAATILSRHHLGPPRPADHISLAATVIVQGHVYVALVCRVDSSTGEISRPNSRGSLLAVLTSVEGSILPSVVKHLLLTDATLTLGSNAPHNASAILSNAEGEGVATLSWTPRRPGTALLVGALPVILVVVGVLGMAVALAYLRGSRSALALVASEARAKHLAFHDQLTELPNRRLLKDRLVDTLAHARDHNGCAALLLIDLDHFKAVNDTYGHPSGDELLREVARRLVQACRQQDVCARLGGDEFVILATDCSPANATILAERVLARIAEPIVLSAATVQISGSVGISVYPQTACDGDELLRQADVALYQAKDSEAGTCCFFEASIDEEAQSRRSLEVDLHNALRDGAIWVAYQPQFCGGLMVGVEALARWTHPTRGPISPGSFAPLAEQCGLIEELGLQVLARAFVDGRRWPGLRVAVNLSAVQLKMRSFLPKLERLIAETGARPLQFELEITEGVLMADDAAIQQTLATLRIMGFSLALDDFGVGYSSLSYLRRFPIDKIKIDQSFVARLPGDKVSVALVRAIVHLSQALGLSVIAEGVETTAQRDSLTAMGCNTVQGYLTGRPVPADEIDVLVASAPTQRRVTENHRLVTAQAS